MIAPKLIGIVGGSCSGKTTFAEYLNEHYDGTSIVLSQDCYYRGLGVKDNPLEYNFDHPSALELDRMAEDLSKLKEGRKTIIPVYDFSTHQRLESTNSIEPHDIIIVEGLFLFHLNTLRDLFDVKIFFDVPALGRLNRRLERDEASRGRSRNEVLWRFNEHCEPAYQEFIFPSARYADLMITPEDGFGSVYNQQVANAVTLIEKLEWREI